MSTFSFSFSGDSRQQRIYTDNIDKPVNGEFEKYIRATKK